MKNKIDLIKTTNVRKASSISKIKVKLSPHPNMNNYTGVKMKSRIREIINSFNEYNLRSKSTAAILIKAENYNITKENVILALREDLEYHKKINRNYNIYKKYANDICDYYKQNFDEIFQYKSNLRDDLKDFIKIVDGYEEEKPVQTGTVTTNGSNLNVRNGASTDYDIIGQLKNFSPRSTA